MPGCQRVTGINRVGARCEKSGLTLQVMNHQRGSLLSANADKNVYVGLFDDDALLTGGWSLDRILNCWTSKHNEAVYIPAFKSGCSDADLLASGHKPMIEFSDRLLWCRTTSAEQLFEALYNGTLFLDPAPKYCLWIAKLTKRRSQWRVNDIAQAAKGPLCRRSLDYRGVRQCIPVFSLPM